MSNFKNLPSQKLPFKKKNKEWRQRHIDWAENYVWTYDSSIRKSLKNKIINYNLINGKLDLSDIKLILNPDDIKASYVPDDIQHYPILNSKINLLLGEELKRRFDYKLIVTNPSAVSEIETNKKNKWMEDLSQWATQTSENEEEAQRDLEKIVQYNKYEWQDIREIRGNCVLNHYMKELSFPMHFNKGFLDLIAVGECAYQCSIVGGEPTIEKLNPNKVIVLRSGYSNKIEDADMIVLWDYWSPGRIIDTYYDVLTDKDVQYINDLPFSQGTDDLDIIDPRSGFVFTGEDGVMSEADTFDSFLGNNNVTFNTEYSDNYGNIRVISIYWKSFRKVLKVKSYDLETGEEIYNVFPENHIIDTDMGEEAKTMWIDEAWEATKIGGKIYVNMRPKIVQYNRLDNPSRCHFGVIGSVLNTNEGRPYSLVDMGKPYNYLYNVVHDRLNKNLAANWGHLLEVDYAKIPKGWEMDKWLYYAKVNKIAVKDSFKEGHKGAATGKLSGMLNNQSSGSINVTQGDIIQQDVNLLQFIKQEMSEVMGITAQREGQVHNRETVGGVERAVLQSSHSTEWLYSVQEDIKKRVIECFLETAKAAMKGKTKKFQYILSDGSMKVMDIDGDEFAESDYGIVVDNSNNTQLFIQKMESYAQSLIQNQVISTSSLIKLWNGSSVSDITRSIEFEEAQKNEQLAQQQEQQAQQFQEELQARNELEQYKLSLEEEKNIRDNETKILIEQMRQQAIQEARDFELNGDEDYDPVKRMELENKIKEHNDRLALERAKLEEVKRNNKVLSDLKEKDINNKLKQNKIIKQ